LLDVVAHEVQLAATASARFDRVDAELARRQLEDQPALVDVDVGLSSNLHVARVRLATGADLWVFDDLP
jgi:hypothetical protein